MRRAALPVALAAALVSGCGAEPDEGLRSGPPAAVARIACGQDGARVLTPEVEARRDGLHLQLTNETVREVHVTVERDSSGAAGIAAPPGTSAEILTVGPGEWAVTCYGESALPAEAPTFELVDTGVWVSTELTDCETPEATHGDPPRSIGPDEGELVDVARRALDAFVDLEPGYALERAGYPEQAEAVFRARSGDRTVATMSFYPDGSGGWVEGEARACPETGGSPEPGG